MILKKNRNTAIKSQKILIYGKHAVLAALKNPKRVITAVYLSENSINLINIIENLQNKENKNFNLKIVKSSFIKNNFSTAIKHQGIIAEAFKLELKDFFQVINDFKEKEKSLGVILDNITDPNNIGAIYRASFAFKVDFLISEKKNSPYENNTILNAACGSFEKLPTFKTANLNQAIKAFKNSGWWIIGLDHNSNLKINDFFKEYSSIKKILLVLGSEGKGIKRLVKENCDYLISIETADQQSSINVSNATSIFLHTAYNKVIK